MTTDVTVYSPSAPAGAPTTSDAPPDYGSLPALQESQVPADWRGYAWEAPQGYEVDAGDHDAFRRRAQAAGITGKQFKWLMGEVVKYERDRVPIILDDALGAREDATIAALREEWGARFDHNVQLARHAFQTLGGTQAEAPLLTTNRAAMRLLARMGERLAQGGRTQPGGAAAATSADILPQAKLDAIVREMMALPPDSARRHELANWLKRHGAALTAARGGDPNARV